MGSPGEMLAARNEAMISPQEAAQLVADHIRTRSVLAQAPLFIMGSGVSAGRVPLLSEIGWWLKEQLENRKRGIAEQDQFVIDYSLKLASNKASRREVAQLFSTIQGEVPSRSGQIFNGIWREFSERLMNGSFTIRENGKEKNSMASVPRDWNLAWPTE